jgi:hypothetical protein
MRDRRTTRHAATRRICYVRRRVEVRLRAAHPTLARLVHGATWPGGEDPSGTYRDKNLAQGTRTGPQKAGRKPQLAVPWVATGVSVSSIKAAEPRRSWRIVAVLARTSPAIAGPLGLGVRGSDAAGRPSRHVFYGPGLHNPLIVLHIDTERISKRPGTCLLRTWLLR